MLASYWGEQYTVWLVIIEKVNTLELIQSQLPNVKLISLEQSGVLKSFPSLIRVIKRLKPDLIMSTLTHVNIVAILISKLFGIKVVIRESSVFSVMNSFNSKSKIIEYLVRVLYPFSDAIVCQSQDIFNDFRSRYPNLKKKLNLINNPILVNSLPSWNPLHSDSLQIVHVGAFRPEKGQFRMLEVLEYVNIPYQLTFVGDGSLRELVEQEVQKRGMTEFVRFTGNVIPPYDYISKASLFVQTSFVEGFPNALLEALAIGVPCVAYDVPGGTKELITRNNGLLIKDGDVEAFASAINTFDVDSYNSSTIRKDIENRFDVSAIVAKYQAIRIS